MDTKVQLTCGVSHNQRSCLTFGLGVVFSSFSGLTLPCLFWFSGSHGDGSQLGGFSDAVGG